MSESNIRLPMPNVVTASRTRTARLAGLIAALLPAALLLAACGAPAGTPDPAPTPESTLSKPTAIVNTNANVRAGPNTNHAAVYWLETATEVTVVGRNADGTWLQIEHSRGPGWIFAGLLDFDADVLADLPEATVDAPEPTPEPAVVVVPTRTPEPAEAVAPEAVSEPPASDAVWLTVTGSAVNVREGPGTDHPIALRAAAGDRFEVVARNADGSWLQVADPRTADGRLWIYGPLTDASGALVAGLVLAEAGRIEETESPAAEPASEPAPPPARLPPPPPQSEIDACAQWHRVNPNETRLVQITDWYELDLNAVAERNRLDPAAPLTTGMELCLDLGEPGHHVAAPEPPLWLEWYAGSGAMADPTCPRCGTIPHFPEEAVRSVPGVATLYKAPGTYDRNLPGLDYDWEWVLSDDSTMWDWTVRDRAACYDGLRAHMGDVPESVGLTRIEYRLSDPIFGEESYHDLREMGMSTSLYYPGIAGGSNIPWDSWPNWQPGMLPNRDLALVSLRCYGNTGPTWSRSEGELFCRISPRWGNSGSIHLEAATTMLMANAVGHVSRQSKWFQGGWDRSENVAYLYPVIDGDGDNPAGSGPCMVITRSP